MTAADNIRVLTPFLSNNAKKIKYHPSEKTLSERPYFLSEKEQINSDFRNRLIYLGMDENSEKLHHWTESPAINDDLKKKITTDSSIDSLLKATSLLLSAMNKYLNELNSQNIQPTSSTTVATANPYSQNVLSLSEDFRSTSDLKTQIFQQPPTISTSSKIEDDGKQTIVSISKLAEERGLTPDPSWEGRELDSEVAEAFLKANSEFLSKTGRNIRLESAYRSKERNAAVGGSETSNHILGDAIDIAYKDVDEAKEILESNGLKQLGGTWRGLDERNHFSVTGS